jgi:hypothetical protein
MVQPEVIVVPMVFGIPALVVFFRMWFRHKEKMAEMKGTATHNPMLEARLMRIEEAVETIAIEMERMGEGQRFVTKLLADRAALPEGQGTIAGDRAKAPK